MPVEESDWMGDLSISLGVYYQTGIARGNYSLLSSMDVEPAEFFAAFGNAINNLILLHAVDLEKKRWRTAAGPSASDHHFTATYHAKTRWVDGTPEYSFYICGLRKLFPQARFVHVLRDVTSVVRSMLHFEKVSGRKLVADENEAYTYWLKTVSNCLLAERAYGRNVVFRLPYSQLVQQPESAIRSLLDFLDEPFSSECLKPMAKRINSSNVPPDFEIDLRKVDPRLVQQATALYRETECTPQALHPSQIALDEIEAAFQERVRFMASLPKEYRKVRDKIAKVEAATQQPFRTKQPPAVGGLRLGPRISNTFLACSKAVWTRLKRGKEKGGHVGKYEP